MMAAIISKQSLTCLISDLKVLLAEMEDLLENGERKFQYYDYRKADKIEPLTQALRQVIYFDRLQEPEKPSGEAEHGQDENGPQEELKED